MHSGSSSCCTRLAATSCKRTILIYDYQLPTQTQKNIRDSLTKNRELSMWWLLVAETFRSEETAQQAARKDSRFAKTTRTMNDVTIGMSSSRTHMVNGTFTLLAYLPASPIPSNRCVCRILLVACAGGTWIGATRGKTPTRFCGKKCSHNAHEELLGVANHLVLFCVISHLTSGSRTFPFVSAFFVRCMMHGKGDHDHGGWILTRFPFLWRSPLLLCTHLQ